MEVVALSRKIFSIKKTLCADEICDAILARNPNASVFTNSTSNVTYKEVNDRVTGIVTQVFEWKYLVDHAVPIFYVLKIGAWSDKHGRKPPLLLNAVRPANTFPKLTWIEKYAWLRHASER